MAERERDAAFIVQASTELGPNSMDAVGPLIPLEPVFEGMPMPLRGVSHGVDTVRRVLEGKLHPDLPMYTMRHRGQTYVLTLADLRLVGRGPR